MGVNESIPYHDGWRIKMVAMRDKNGRFVKRVPVKEFEVVTTTKPLTPPSTFESLSAYMARGGIIVRGKTPRYKVQARRRG
jgi:hypothetical protein